MISGGGGWGGGIVKHCSVAVGPNKCQPFPFRVPTHHPCTTVTHTLRPCVDLSLISFLLNKGNKVLTDLLKRCIVKIFKGQKIVSRYIKANLYSPARRKYIRVRQVTIPCEVGETRLCMTDRYRHRGVSAPWYQNTNGGAWVVGFVDVSWKKMIWNDFPSSLGCLAD